MAARPRPDKALKPRKPKKNPLLAAKITYVDYKDANVLRQFISDRGKIRSRRVTGLTTQQQRQVARAIKNAREMALLPYISTPSGAEGRKRSRD
jgi:small subunit ribosomal protein S18